MGIKIDTSQFSRALAERKQALHDAVRPAAQAGAQELYIEARLRAPVSAEAHYFYGSAAKAAPKGQKKALSYLFQPGNLRDSIYQVYSKTNSTAAKATYHVSWNASKAPYGHMVEFGTSRMPAHPFLRPALLAAEPMIISAMRGEFLKRMTNA
ncbi:MAG: HK97 gp10 family phage protein [Pseudorhodoferax sp.]